MVSNLVGGFMGSSKRNLQDDSVHGETEKPRCWIHNPRRSGFLAAVVMMSLFFAGQTQATTYYIDKATGSDSRAGTSVSTAWATINKANVTLHAGDTVYIRAGTYDDIIEPTYSGAAGLPITYRNYPGETVILRGASGYRSIVAIGVGMRGNSNPKSYIVVDGFTIRHGYLSGFTGYVQLVYLYGANTQYNTIRNCDIQGQGWVNPTNSTFGGEEQGMCIIGTKHTTIENNHISGWTKIGIYLGGGAAAGNPHQYIIIRGNDVRNSTRSVINIGSNFGVPSYALIENNYIGASWVSDGITWENRYDQPSIVDYDSNRNFIIRNNVIADQTENGMDLKAVAYSVIEGNILHGCINNDGGENFPRVNYRFAGAATIMHGAGNGTLHNIIRRNVIYDGQGGITPEGYYKIYNNTIIYNNRDYTGPNSSWTDTRKPTFDAIAAWNAWGTNASGLAYPVGITTGVSIKNNIIGGHNAADMLLGGGAVNTLDIDYNLYFNDAGPKLVDYRNTYDWSLVSFSTWPSYLAARGAIGCDAHSLNAAPLLVNAPADLYGPETNFDFHLQANSPAINHGGFLTTTTAAGSGTSIPVADAEYFFSGWGVFDGDLIQLQGQTVRARILSISGNTLVVDRSMTWTAGQGVSLPYEGTAPDIGAFEYQGTSTTYTLTISAVNGTVTKTPNQTSYTSGQTVTLQAVPNTGYTFSGWAGDLTGTANPATLVMNSNKSVTANFTAAPVTYTLTISAVNGTVTKTPNQTSYTSGQTVTLQAVPNTGYTFSGWSGDLTGTTNPATLVMNANKSVTANFTAVAVTYTLAVSATNGTVTKTPNQTSYTSGQTVTLQATPNTGYTFSGWSGDLTGTTNPATLVMNANKSVTANFIAVPAIYTLTISATNGAVTKTPNQTSYTSGQTVTLQATPNAGYTFSGWSGDLTGTTNPATLVMDANKSVAAAFVVAQPAVYYVDRAAGNNSNDGKSPATAWRSLAKVNSYTGFVPGDQILLHRGHIWRESLIVPASGTADKPITVGAYDTGNRPLLKGSTLLRGWTSAGTNQWQTSLSTEPDQVFFNGARGTRMTSQAALTGPQQWSWAAGVLYVYAPSDPGSLYLNPGIEASVSPATRGDGLIQIPDRSYVTVQDIRVTQSASAGICLASSGQGLTVRNCEADNSVDGGIVATSPSLALSNVTIEGCLIHHNNTGLKEGALGVATYQEGLTLEGVNGFAVRGCQIYNNYALGASLKHGSANGVVENCQVNANGLRNVSLDGISKTQIRYNKIYDCAAGTGLGFGLETSTYHNDTVQVYYNLFWNNANGISFTAIPGVTSQTRNLSIYNNTFYNHPVTLRWESAATGHYSGANHVKDNLLWTQATTNVGISDETTGKQGIAQTTIAYNGFQQGAATDTIGTNAQVMTNPYFVNPAAYDFHLQSGSTCIDAGTNVGLTRDFGGDPVPQGGAPDLGVYEYAGFATYTLQVSATNGTVTKTPNQTSYTSGQTVTLQAVPNTGYTFSGWSGDLTGTTNPATLVMNANKSVTANFTAVPVTYTLTISATNGTVTKTPNQTSYTSGQTVTLQATPNAGYTFSGWSGDLTGTTNPATLTMNANKSVTANFTAVPMTYTLSVSATNGTVTKTPNQTSYTSGQTVTLQATPNAGYTFSGWSGDLTGTANPATLTMNANKSVTANFTAITYTLTVNAANGAVTKTPDQTSYTSGQTVTLQAVPNTGYAFSGWSGDLTGTTNPATLVMDVNKSVTATFVAAQPAVYYVDRAAGNNSNDGKSPATAWRSLAKVNSYTGFVPGDQILLHRGHVWREQLIVPASGTADKPITVGAYDTGNRPLLKGSVWLPSWTSAGTNLWTASLSTQPNQVFFSGVRGTRMTSQAALTGPQQWSWAAGVLYVYATSNPSSATTSVIEASVRPSTRTSGLIQIQDHSYVTVQDLHVTQSYSAGICLTSSGQGLTVQNCEADNSADGGIVATSPTVALSNVTIEGCLIHHNNGGIKEGALGVATYQEGLTVEGVNRFVVRGCQISGNYAVGVGLKHGAANGVVENCQVNANGLRNVYLDGASKAQIRYNKVYDCAADAGLQFGLETSTYHNDAIQVYYNLFWNNANGISFTAMPGVTSQTRNLSIYNNTFYNHPVALRWESAATGHYSGANHVKDNLLWTQATTNVGIRDETTGRQGLAQTTVAYNGFQQGAATDTTGTNAQVMTDPYFVNPSAYDFHRSTTNSWTIDTGTNVGLTRDFDGEPVPQGSAPDIGAYESSGNSATAYTLTVSATNGTVSKTPDQTNYTSGQTVTLQATANTGYRFSGWSGDLTGTTNPATLAMDANKSVTANCTAAAVTYTLAISATNGTVTKTPNQTSYTSGQTVTLQATPNTGYKFSGWSGDLTGTTNPATLVMNANKSVTASFRAVGKGSKRLASQAVSTAMNADTSLAPNPTGAASASDQQPPVLGGCSPTPDSIQAAPDTLVVLHVRDVGQGVDGASVIIRVGGHLVYTGDADSQRTVHGVCYRSGTKADYTYMYQPQRSFGFSKEVTVVVDARDLAGNVMPEQTYSFATEMYSFGASRSFCKDQTGLTQGRPATVRDRQGNLWVVWQAGNPGSRHVYAGLIQPEADGSSGTVQLSQSTGDHCRPAIAVDGAGTLYVVWQENASGAWDVCVSTSVDGQTWSAPKSLAATMSSQAQPAVNRVNPAVAAGGSSNGLIAAAWQEDRAGNQDIYVARSTNGFQTATISRVTSDPADQTDPALAIDGQDTVFVLWTDTRDGSTDIYGAASNAGPWANMPVADGTSNQSHCTLAVGTAGRTLHMAWVEDKAGDPDVFYAASEGLPMSPVTGASVIDDTSGADQQAPALTVAAGADGTDHVFLCWEDARNVAYSGATDLYFADAGSGVLRTNVPLEDGASGSPHEVTLGTDRWGYPYVVWVGQGSPTQNSALGSPDSGTGLQLHYSGATYANPVPLAESQIVSSAGGLVGTSPQKIKTLDDVSVAIPALTCPIDATIRAARIQNPRWSAEQSLRQMAFGPSGWVFAQPVTVTIPYCPVGRSEIRVYWFDAATGTFRKDGIANVRRFRAAAGLAALQFETTRLGSFYLVSGTTP